jgi:hypothetical protein
LRESVLKISGSFPREGNASKKNIEFFPLEGKCAENFWRLSPRRECVKKKIFSFSPLREMHLKISGSVPPWGKGSIFFQEGFHLWGKCQEKVSGVFFLCAGARFSIA